jgi:hypothetical protein
MMSRGVAGWKAFARSLISLLGNAMSRAIGGEAAQSRKPVRVGHDHRDHVDGQHRPRGRGAAKPPRGFHDIGSSRISAV